MAETADTQVVKTSGLQTVSDVTKAREMADSLVQGAITSLKKPISVPTTEGVDLSGLEAAVKEASKTNQSTRNVIDESTRTLQAGFEQKTAAERATGKHTADEIMATQQKAQQEADLQRYFANMFGITEDPDALIAKVSKQITAITPVAEAKLERLRQADSVGILDDPAGWFINTLQRPALARDYNAEVDHINLLQGAVDNAIQTGQNAAAFAAKGIPAMTKSQALAKAQLAEDLANKTVGQATETFARENVEFAVRKLADDISIANLDAKMTEEQRQKEHMKYTSAVNAINLADTHAQRMLKAAELIEKLEKTKGLDIILANYDKVTGHPPGTTTRYTFEKFSEPTRQNMVAIGAGSMGTSPFYGTVNFFATHPGPGVSKETMKLFNWLRDESDKIRSSAGFSAIDDKDKPSVIDKRLKLRIEEEMSGATTTGSIFHELEPSTMIAMGAVPAESKLAKILEPYTKQPGSMPTKTIIHAIYENYKDPAEAGQVLAEYYSRNVKLRNEVSNARLAAIDMPNNYIYKAEGVGFGRPKFDLTKPEEATKLILYMNMQKAIPGMMIEAFGTGVGATP